MHCSPEGFVVSIIAALSTERGGGKVFADFIDDFGSELSGVVFARARVAALAWVMLVGSVVAFELTQLASEPGMAGHDLPWFPNWSTLFRLQSEPATIKHALVSSMLLEPGLNLFILPAIAPSWPLERPGAAGVLLHNFSQLKEESDNVETDASFMKDPGPILGAKPSPVDRVPFAPRPTWHTGPKVNLFPRIQQ